jgi:hypothetical protein
MNQASHTTVAPVRTSTAVRDGLPPEVALVGLLLAVVLTAMFVTYWRLPASELYHVSGSGLGGGASRVLVELNFPTALVAIAVLGLLFDRFGGSNLRILAVTGVVLSAAVFWPGVVDETDLDAKPVNALAALGVAVVVVLCVFLRLTAGWAGRLSWRGIEDWARVVLAGAVLLLAVPWLAAEIGLSFDGVPVLGTLYQTGELRDQPGNPELHPAVHHGHHHGMDGVMLVLAALLLSRVVPSLARRGLRLAVGAYLALMLSYGLGEIANDCWLEQVVKRGWTDWEIPNVSRPKVSSAWAVIVLGAVCIYALARRRPGSSTAAAVTAAVGGSEP